jgi:hypothetical protein
MIFLPQFEIQSRTNQDIESFRRRVRSGALSLNGERQEDDVLLGDF